MPRTAAATQWGCAIAKACRAARGPPPRAMKDLAKMSAVRLLAALRESRVLRLLGDAELEYALRRDLDRLTGRRVAPEASLAVHDHELADAWEREAVTRFLVGQGRELLENQAHLLLCQLRLLREPLQCFRL